MKISCFKAEIKKLVVLSDRMPLCRNESYYPVQVQLAEKSPIITAGEVVMS